MSDVESVVGNNNKWGVHGGKEVGGGGLGFSTLLASTPGYLLGPGHPLHNNKISTIAANHLF
jgi:hypothetical protein